jgi:hypothetical protein
VACEEHRERIVGVDFMPRRMLQPVVLGVFIMAGSALASAYGTERGGAFEIAMAPVGAPLKPGGSGANRTTVPTCVPTDAACHKPRHPLSKRRHPH